jgi:hypothetical protein
MTDNEMTFREFTIRGTVYSGNASHAEHTVYWAIRNSDSDSAIMIEEITIEAEEEDE